MSSLRRRKLPVLLASLTLAVGVYAAVGFLLVPRLLRSNLRELVATNYQRKLAIGEIRCNPFTLALELQNFSLPDADGQPLLAFRRLSVAFDLASVWRRAGGFRFIELDEPFGRVLVRADGSLNLADLARPFAAKEHEPADSKPARMFINRLTVRAAALHLEDRTHAKPFVADFRPMSFELREFSTLGESANRYVLHASSTSGEVFEWNGSFSVTPFASRGRFALRAAQAPTLWSYIRDSVDFEYSRGAIALSGGYEISTQPALTLKVNIDEAHLSDIGVRPHGAANDYLRVAQLLVQDSHLDLVRRSAQIGKLRLTGADVNAWRDAAGHINLLELLPAKASAATPPDTAPVPAPAAPWVLAAPDIGVESLRVRLEDRMVAPAAQLTLDPVDLQLKGFSTAPGTRLDFAANLRLVDSGTIAAQGSLTPASGALTADLVVAGFDLRTLQPYIDEYTRMTLLGGWLAAKVKIERGADGLLGASGETTVARLHTIDAALRQDFIKWDELRATDIEYQSQPAKLRIGGVALKAPYARVIIAADRTVNLEKVLTAAPSPGPPTHPEVLPATDPARPPLAVSIGTVRLTNGSANFTDFWIQPNYAVSLAEMTGSIVGLSSAKASRARMKLDGKVDRYAPATLGGELNLLSASLFTNIKLSFDGVDLTSVTPYAGRFAGYKIEKGKLSVDVTYHVEDRKLEAQQRFVVNELQLGERVESPDAVKLPLRLAVALLKDRNGVIDIDLPMSGSLDDPQFKLGPLIWKAFVGLLGKIATAPFALIGRMFGGGPEVNLIDFAPGEATLDAAGLGKIAAVRKGMQERPGLDLDVPMAYAPAVDGPVLAARKLDDKLLRLAAARAGARKRNAPAPDAATLTDPAMRLELLVAQFRQELGAEAPLPAAVAGIVNARGQPKGEPEQFGAGITALEQAITAHDPVTEAELSTLGQQRARAVQDALMGDGGIEAARVFAIASSSTDASDKVRLELSLK